MGVYIKGMGMPKQCYDCYLVAMDMDSGKLYCKHLNEDIEDWSGILPACPLVEVKTPHGRLIDADVANNFVKPLMAEDELNACTIGSAKALIWKTIELTPTLIEAEEE